MLKIKIPKLCKNEQCYVLDILLSEFLGFNFEVETYENNLIEQKYTLKNNIDNLTKETLPDASYIKYSEVKISDKFYPSYWEDLKIYVNTQEELREHWKVKRDIQKRGYTREQVLAQIELRKPDASRSRSSEIYAICDGLR